MKIIIRKRKQFLEAFIFEYAGIVGIFRLLLWRWGRLACIIRYFFLLEEVLLITWFFFFFGWLELGVVLKILVWFLQETCRNDIGVNMIYEETEKNVTDLL